MSEATEIVLQKIDPEMLDVGGFISWQSMAVKDDAGAELCTARLSEIAKHKALITSRLKEVTAPLEAVLATLRGAAKGPLGELENVDKSLRNKMRFYLSEKERVLAAARRAEQDRVAAEMRERAAANARKAEVHDSDHHAALAEKQFEIAQAMETEPVRVKQQIKTQSGAVNTRKVWKWRISEVERIPDEFFVLDTKRLDTMARGQNLRPQQVPGIEFFQEIDVSVKASGGF